MLLNLKENDSKVERYNQLVAAGDHSSNAGYLAAIITSYLQGESALPKNLGLDDDEIKRLLEYYFPNDIAIAAELVAASLSVDRVDVARLDEFEELLSLMTTQRRNENEYEVLIAKIVTSACMGSDHLWQDLGLWSRKDLSSLLSENFPSLAAKNTKNMKWKRFFYKQLCDAEGIYVCRSPSCEVCADYKVCFAPEE